MWAAVLVVLLWPALGWAIQEKQCGDMDFENCDIPGASPPGDKWVVCYFTSWSSRTRKGNANFQPEDINASLCTHVVMSYAVLDKDTLTIAPGNKKLDLEDRFYERVTALRSQGLKVGLFIGGGADTDDGDKWFRLVRSDPARSEFVKSVVQFLEKHHFDGLTVGFYAPGCKEGALPTDKDKYNLLLSELKVAFNGRFMLSIDAPAGKKTSEECYNLQGAIEHLDYLNLNTYGYFDHSDGVTGSMSPMCGTPTRFAVYESVEYYLDVLKCPPAKIVLGLNFYGHSYTMKEGETPGFGAAVTGPGEAGPLLNMAGFMTYYEVCMFSKQGWQTGYDKVKGNYIWKDNQFVSAPSIADIKKKSCLVNRFGLRGANLWSMDYDDFNNQCGCGTWPLLKTLNTLLRGKNFEVKCY